MKRFGRILLIITLGIALLLGGLKLYLIVDYQKMLTIATSREAKKVYENYIKKENPQAFTDKGSIQSYHIIEKSLSSNPMGGIMVTIYLNQTEEATISFNLLEGEDGEYHSAFFVLAPEVQELFEDKNNMSDTP